MDIVLFGIQGSGKGTQARRLAEEFGFDLFEAGGELRKIAASGSDLGNTVKSYIDAGNLVPHEIIMEVVKTSINKRGKNQKILFDGVPRDEDQMRDFSVIMQDLEREYHCIQLLLPREKAVERILGRAAEEGRTDDANMESINKRMDIFEEKTLPVIRTYQHNANLTKVDGDGSMDEVYEKLKTVITSLIDE